MGSGLTSPLASPLNLVHRSQGFFPLSFIQSTLDCIKALNSGSHAVWLVGIDSIVMMANDRKLQHRQTENKNNDKCELEAELSIALVRRVAVQVLFVFVLKNVYARQKLHARFQRTRQR